MKENQKLIGKVRVIAPGENRRAIKLFDDLASAREFVRGTSYVLEYKLAKPRTAKRVR